MPAEIPSEAQVREWIVSLRNWGRWGEDDELGCLNLITPEKRTRAAGLVQDGETVSCARPIVTDITPDVTHQVQRFMVDSGEGRDTDSPESRLSRPGAMEYIGMVFHGYSITHIDAPSHYSWEGVMYNGKPANLVTSREGATVLSIENTYRGIVSRGVLLDIPRAQGVRWLTPGYPIMPEDLEAAEKLEGVRIEEGDILLVRTGNYRRILDDGPVEATSPNAACQVACTPWLKERGVAMLGTDTPNHVQPGHYPNLTRPLHRVCLVSMGLWLIDNANLEELAEACHRRGRYEFMLAMGPLRLRNVTGSPINPIAVF